MVVRACLAKKCFVALGLIALVSRAGANCNIFESYADALAGNVNLERTCTSLYGGGATYYGKILAASESAPVSCDGAIFDEDYVVIYGCNTCTSKNVQERLKQDTVACAKECRTAMNACVYDGISNNWGGYYNVKKHPTCNSLKSTSLPGCAESSSSSEQNSSSSAQSSSSEASSSSKELMSSGTESSSSGGDNDDSSSSMDSESSSSEEIDSSSSQEESSSSVYESSSSENTSSSSWYIFPCYKSNGVGGCEVEKYVSFEPLPMAEEPQLNFGDKRVVCFYTKDGSATISFLANIPMQITSDVRSDVCFHDMNDCGNIDVFDSEHVIPSIQQPFYLCDFSAGTPNGCVEKNAGLRITEKLQLAETRTGWFYPKNLTDDIAIALANEAIERAQAVEIYYDGKYVKTESYRQRVDNDVAAAIDDCIFYAQLYEKRHMSSSSYSSSSSSISSSSAEESSSSESSSSSKQSSSSLSSGSEPESSSSEPESSSSVLEESSSSYVEAETFVPGGDQVYTPDQVFNDGLQNMEDGKCYSLNPDRGTVYGWDLSLNAQDPWWWREVDCNTGKKPVKAGIGVCAAYPDTVPENETACYAYNGSCYVCDNSRDYVDCSQSWLWMFNFPGHDWFKKVDCYDPYEEENINVTGKCLDESLLRKQSSDVFERKEVSISYSVNYLQPVKKFDALGRHGIDKLPSHMALYKKKMILSQPEIENSVVLQLPTISSADYCDRDSLGKWTCNRNKKALKKRVWSVDEFVDPSRCDIKKGTDYWYYTINYDPSTGEELSRTYVGGFTCAWPNVDVILSYKKYTPQLIYDDNKRIVGAKAVVPYAITSKTTLGENNHIIMKKGDYFSDGHVVTKEDENTYKKHEQGHEFYNTCVSFDEVEENGEFECAVDVSESMSQDERTKLLNDAVAADLIVKRKNFEDAKLQNLLNEAQRKIDLARDRFHADFGLDGYAGKNGKLPKKYKCPNY